ncbi:MAG: endonuclease, partial [Alistipes sp.]|nr:endonuclease [Alistipes sp.]
MAKGEYYDGYGSRNAPKERRGFLLWLLDSVMAVCSVIALVLLVIVWLVPRIHPAYMWALPMLGLVA